MPIYLRDILQKPDLLDTLVSGDTQTCCKCQVSLQETITGRRDTPDGSACSDCYYELLGAEIERHPIASAGVRRT